MERGEGGRSVSCLWAMAQIAAEEEGRDMAWESTISPQKMIHPDTSVIINMLCLVKCVSLFFCYFLKWENFSFTRPCSPFLPAAARGSPFLIFCNFFCTQVLRRGAAAALTTGFLLSSPTVLQEKKWRRGRYYEDLIFPPSI